jgi:hypothetical protein
MQQGTAIQQVLLNAHSLRLPEKLKISGPHFAIIPLINKTFLSEKGGTLIDFKTVVETDTRRTWNIGKMKTAQHLPTKLLILFSNFGCGGWI